MTRAKAKQQLEEKLIRKGELRAFVWCTTYNTLVCVNEPAACGNVVPYRSESEADQAERQSPMKNSKLTKDQRREIRKKARETKKSREGGNSEYPDITIEDVIYVHSVTGCGHKRRGDVQHSVAVSSSRLDVTDVF